MPSAAVGTRRPQALPCLAQAAVTVVYKEFGIRLNFTPTIAGDVIRLQVKPEVSSLDFANGVTLSGFRIPALTTRRAETDVELRDGQSFAIAGLMNNIAQSDRQAIPILSSLPIVGALFKSRSIRQQKTELMVLITPHLVRALNPDEVPTLPTAPQDFIKDEQSELYERVRAVNGAAFAVRDRRDTARFAEIDSARQLAHDHDVKAAHDFRFQGGGLGQGVVAGAWRVSS